MAVAIVADVLMVVQEAERLKGYWDDSGLDMHLAVKENGQIAVSSKHWGRVHYLTPREKTSPTELWKALHQVREEIGRTLVKSQQGPYVYIPKLSDRQTRQIFRKLKRALKAEVTRKFEFSWDIEDAILEEELNQS